MSHAQSWSQPGVLDFFSKERGTTADVYPSEWFFLKDRLQEGMRVLDIGCAQGGFASVLGEHLTSFRYTGVDISPDMIALAQERHPDHRFLCCPEGDLSALGDERFDLVLVLGILHLHESWRQTLATAWTRTSGALLFDLRETEGPTLDDKTVSWFGMDFSGDTEKAELRLPYIVLNAGEALAEAVRLTDNAARLSRYGYRHPPSRAARTPLAQIMTSAYLAEK
ncbi:MAG: class I SAM-dependent methyltransferase [Alphaproteobacteria bacterium]|nr:class I SAM-dependent methyltransferase [Alphaproteobacteria bacterium]